MAQQMVVMLWCDVHLHEEAPKGTARVGGVTFVIGAQAEHGGEYAVYEMEMCIEHSKASLLQVVEWASLYGRPRDLQERQASKQASQVRYRSISVYAPTEDGRLQCPYCEETRVSSGRMDNHIRRIHPGKPLGAGEPLESRQEYPPKVLR